jgi:heat shock protein HtpX
VAPLDESERTCHKRRNVVHSLLLLGGMVALAGLCGWLLFGPDGMLGLGLGMALALGFGPQVSPRMVLRLYRAQPLRPVQAPELYALLERLCVRAGLERCPELYYLPSAMLNPFAVGRRHDAAIAVTDGLLRQLSMREVAGVLAHELSHVRNDDLWLMNLADLVGRMTRVMTLFGLMLVVLGLPGWLASGQGPPLLLVPLLVFAPQLTVLLQLALSRAREFDADLDAAGLTGDPAGLASALLKLERYQGGFLERILMPGRRIPVPSLLRTHPP